MKLKVEERAKSANALRKEGMIPAVFYGPKEEATPIQLKVSDFEKVYKQAGTSQIIILEGVGDEKEALIYDVQLHPLTNKPIHADFYVIERGKKLSVEVPLVFVGEAPAEKKGLILVKQMHEIEISVRPSEIPHEIEVDLSKLESEEDTITVKDLPLPPSAEPEIEEDEIIVSVVAAQEEPEEETEQMSIEDIEVEKKGKTEEEAKEE